MTSADLREAREPIPTANDTEGARFVQTYASVLDEEMQAETAWICALRADGVKAAHPDDGWVNREANTVHIQYPRFNDGAAVGDMIALGDHERYRLVRVTGVDRLWWGGIRLAFEDRA